MNLAQWVGFFCFVSSVYILWEIRELLLLVFAAIVFATSINRLVRQLQKWGVKKRISAILLSLLIIICFFSLCWLVIVLPVAGEFRQLAVLVPEGLKRLNEWIDQSKEGIPGSILDFLPDIDSLSEQLQPVLNDFLGRSFSFFSNSLVVILHLLFVIVLTLMLLFDPQAYRRAFIRLFPSFYRSRAESIINSCEVALGGWLVGVFFNIVMIGIFSVIGLSLLGIKLAFAQGLMAGLLMFVPNIGPTISVIPPMAIALLDSSFGIWKSFAVLALYLSSHLLESHLLTPLFMAKQVALLPGGILLAQIFFASIFGFLGLFLAIPLAVVTQIWIKEVLIIDILDQWRKQPQIPPENNPEQSQQNQENIDNLSEK